MTQITHFRISDFGFLSDFDIRISDLAGLLEQVLTKCPRPSYPHNLLLKKKGQNRKLSHAISFYRSCLCGAGQY